MVSDCLIIFFNDVGAEVGVCEGVRMEYDGEKYMTYVVLVGDDLISSD
jgi:hypothetical protein